MNIIQTYFKWNGKLSYGNIPKMIVLHNADAKYHKDIASKFIQLVSTLKFNQFAENNYTNYYAIFDAEMPMSYRIDETKLAKTSQNV